MYGKKKRKRVIKRYRKTEDIQSLLLKITDKVPGLIGVYSVKTGEYIYVNKAVKQILGFTPQDFIKGGFSFVSSLIHPDDKELLMEKNNQAMKIATKKKFSDDNEPIINFEYRMKHKHGGWRWLHTDGSVLSRTKNNEIEYVINISLDITERKEQEKTALQDLENLKYALNQSAIVAITDKRGIIQYINDKFIEISKYPREELIGKTHRVINSKFHPKPFFKEMWDTILSGKVWRGEIRNRSKLSNYYWVDTTITPLLDKSGKPKQFIAIRNDITKRKELERQKDEFIGIASHELKTPVTSLKGYVQVLHKRFMKQNDNVSALFMAKMDAQINKLNSLIQDLLDVTKIETGKLQFHVEVFEIDILVKEIVEALQLTTEKHTIHVVCESKWHIAGDRERIGQVITNLLSNAIKYSPHSSEIIVTIESSQSEVKICVKDFGVGIAKEKQPHLFERFYRVSGAKEDTFPGLGLGLYISAELIKRHNGRIWVESEKGCGSTFCFTIPLFQKGIKSKKNSLVTEEMKHE